MGAGKPTDGAFPNRNVHYEDIQIPQPFVLVCMSSNIVAVFFCQNVNFVSRHVCGLFALLLFEFCYL